MECFFFLLYGWKLGKLLPAPTEASPSSQIMFRFGDEAFD